MYMYMFILMFMKFLLKKEMICAIYKYIYNFNLWHLFHDDCFYHLGQDTNFFFNI